MTVFYSWRSTVLNIAMLQFITAEPECISIIPIAPEHALRLMGEVTLYIRSILSTTLASYLSHVITVEEAS